MRRSAPPSLTFEEVYRRFAPRAWRALRRLGVPERHCPDALQEVFVVVHRRLRELDDHDRLCAWIVGVARKIAAKQRQRDRREPIMDEDAKDVDGERAPRSDPERRSADRDLLLHLLATLAPERREVFVLHELEGFTSPEISRTLEIPEGTVATHLSARWGVVRLGVQGVGPAVLRRRLGEERQRRLLALVVLRRLPVTSPATASAAQPYGPPAPPSVDASWHPELPLASAAPPPPTPPLLAAPLPPPPSEHLPVWHSPAQALSQQMPPTQKPLAQSVPSPHVLPLRGPGSKSSALERAFHDWAWSSCAPPPATRTLPSPSKATPKLVRAAAIAWTADQLFVRGSYSSALENVSHPVSVSWLPPATSTLPLSSRTARCESRAAVIGGVSDQPFVAGS